MGPESMAVALLEPHPSTWLLGGSVGEHASATQQGSCGVQHGLPTCCDGSSSAPKACTSPVPLPLAGSPTTQCEASERSDPTPPCVPGLVSEFSVFSQTLLGPCTPPGVVLPPTYTVRPQLHGLAPATWSRGDLCPVHLCSPEFLPLTPASDGSVVMWPAALPRHLPGPDTQP